MPSVTEYAPMFLKTRKSAMAGEASGKDFVITSAVVQSEPQISKLLQFSDFASALFFTMENIQA